MAIKEVKITQKTTHRSRATASYFSEITFPVLSPEEELNLFYKIRQGDQGAYEKIIKCNLRFVISVAKQFAPRNDSDALLELIQEGNLGLMHAIRDFDTTTGFKFITYAVWHIRQRIMLSLNNNKAVRYSENIIQDRQMVRKIIDLLEVKLERKPIEEEIYEMYCDKFNNRKTKLTEEQIRGKISNYFSDAGTVRSLDEILINSDSDTTFGELIADNSLNHEPMFNKNDRDRVTHLLLDKLHGKERTLIEMTYGLDGDIPSIHRAALAHDLTVTRARQINTESLLRMKRHVGKNLSDHINFDE
jgi:RNA polymerase primary sigma factor